MTASLENEKAIFAKEYEKTGGTYPAIIKATSRRDKKTSAAAHGMTLFQSIMEMDGIKQYLCLVEW